MFAKLANPRFLLDIRPLLPTEQAQTLDEAVRRRRLCHRLLALYKPAAGRSVGKGRRDERALRAYQYGVIMP